jgi:hypothetical protein
MIPNELQLILVDNTRLNISYIVTINGKTHCSTTKDCTRVYTVSCTADRFDITIVKENIWKETHFLNNFLCILYSFDLFYGNLSISDNLPFEINSKISIPNAHKHYRACYNLSDMIIVDETSLNKWRRVSLFQYVCVFILLAFVLFIFGCLFNGWHRIVFGIVALLLNCTLFWAICKRGNKIFRLLKSYVV